MTQRSIPVCIILSIVTCGIYGMYWFVKMTDEANQLSGKLDDFSGGIALLLNIVTCNIFGIYWAYKMGEKLDMAKQQRNMPTNNGAILYLILQLVFPIVGWALMQDEINKLIGA